MTPMYFPIGSLKNLRPMNGMPRATQASPSASAYPSAIETISLKKSSHDTLTTTGKIATFDYPARTSPLERVTVGTSAAKAALLLPRAAQATSCRESSSTVCARSSSNASARPYFLVTLAQSSDYICAYSTTSATRLSLFGRKECGRAHRSGQNAREKTGRRATTGLNGATPQRLGVSKEISRGSGNWRSRRGRGAALCRMTR
mmetsp:Transcript_3214/g.8363  ORF Transcript_3214/g.8363 Transcript_3214/m.8363 type:complete len:203 (-) Transcript_3214:205-813(-)